MSVELIPRQRWSVDPAKDGGLAGITGQTRAIIQLVARRQMSATHTIAQINSANITAALP